MSVDVESRSTVSNKLDDAWRSLSEKPAPTSS
jgi:hypothetical protein